MRPLLAFLTVITILGGLQLYMLYRPQRTAVVGEQPEQRALGRFQVELTLTFDAGPDEFALDRSDAPTLLVRLRGQDVMRRTEPVEAVEQVVADVAGLVAGRNEFFVQATPRETTAERARAVRVRVLRDGTPIADQTLWSEPGELVQGALLVELLEWSLEPSNERS
jgi:hypothetical protein